MYTLGARADQAQLIEAGQRPLARLHLTRRAILDIDEIDRYSIERWGGDVAQQYLSYFALAVVAVAAWGFLIASEEAMQSMQGDGVVMDMMWAMMDPDAVLAYFVAATVMWV